MDSPSAPPASRSSPRGSRRPWRCSSPPTDGDTINVNVIVNRASTTRADWVARSKKEFGEVGFTTIAERNLSVNGWDAVEIEYSGALEGNDFHWLSLSVITNDRVYLVTCTASAPAYAAAEKEFRACLQSFAVDAAKPASALGARAGEVSGSARR